MKSTSYLIFIKFVMGYAVVTASAVWIIHINNVHCIFSNNVKNFSLGEGGGLRVQRRMRFQKQWKSSLSFEIKQTDLSPHVLKNGTQPFVNGKVGCPCLQQSWQYPWDCNCQGHCLPWCLCSQKLQYLFKDSGLFCYCSPQNLKQQ